MNATGPAPRWLKPAVDYGPLAVFFASYLLLGLMAATAALIAARVFGGLTLWLQDETFIKMKPTIVQAIFALVLLGGLAVGRPLLKPLLATMMPPMSDRAWRQFTLRYGLFFVAMAALNELVWRTQSTDVWVTFKVFGLSGLTFLFILSQLPFVGRATRLAQPAQDQPESTPAAE
jgi:intracellular septation protein